MRVLIDLKNKGQTKKGKILTNTGFLFFRNRAFLFQDLYVQMLSLVKETHARVFVFNFDHKVQHIQHFCHTGPLYSFEIAKSLR